MDPSGNFFGFIIAAIAAIFVVAAVVSVVASTVSLIASATGHERTAQRAAKVAVTAAWVAVGAAAVLSIAQPETGGGALRASGWILAYAYTAQAVANRDRIQQTAADLGVSEQVAMRVASVQSGTDAKPQAGESPQLPGIMLPGISPYGPRFVHQRPDGSRYWSYSPQATPAGEPSPSRKAAKSLRTYYNDPGRILRTTGRVLSEFGHPGIGRPMSITGLVIEPGGTGKLIGIASGGVIGAAVGGRVAGLPGAIIGSIVGGTAGGAIGAHADDPSAGYLNYGE